MSELDTRLSAWLERCERHVGMDMYAEVAMQGIKESDLMVRNVIDLALERIEELEQVKQSTRPSPKEMIAEGLNNMPDFDGFVSDFAKVAEIHPHEAMTIIQNLFEVCKEDKQ